MNELDRTCVDEEFYQAHRAGQPIILAARNSNSNGTTAYRLAVEDLLSAAEFLASRGLDIRKVLPSKELLINDLRSCPPIKSKQTDGKSFSNRYLRIDLRATHGVIVIISAGSGKKLDADASQPFVAHVAEVIRSSRACALLGKRIDRLSRNAWALGLAVNALQANNGFIGDETRIAKASGPESLLLFFQAHSSEDEASKLPAKSARGLINGTGRSLASGRSPASHAHLLPPGLFSYKSRNSGQLGGRFITFDTPSCFPRDNEVAAGLPTVNLPNGQPVDQVENVRWALATIGRPGWPTIKVVTELVRRQYSTDGIRRTHGLDASLAKDVAIDRPFYTINAIVKHLDFYESGRLPVRIGIEGFDDFFVEDCFPPDGRRWCQPEDVIRIRQWREERTPEHARTLSFSGVRVDIDGQDCVFRTHSLVRANGEREHRLAAFLAGPSFDHWGEESPGFPCHLPVNLLNSALAEALIAAGDLALAMSPMDLGIDANDGLQSQRTSAQRALQVLKDQRDAIERQLGERDASGAALLHGALLSVASREYDNLVTSSIPRAEFGVSNIESTSLAIRSQRLREHHSVALESLLHLIATLRDPFNCAHVDLIRRGVSNMRIASSQNSRDRAKWIDMNISFDFTINDGRDRITIPVSATFTRGQDLTPEGRGEFLLQQLLATPTPFNQLDVVQARMSKEVLAERLNVDPKRFLLPRVDDPRLAYLAVKVLESRDVTAVAEEMGEPTRKQPWSRKTSELLRQWYAYGSTGKPVSGRHFAEAGAQGITAALYQLRKHPLFAEWAEVGSGHYQLESCVYCQSVNRQIATFREAQGSICVDCRRDRGGFIWPADPYDQYL